MRRPTPAFAAWAVMSLWPGFAIAHIDAGVLYILALAGFGAYGIIRKSVKAAKRSPSAWN